MARFHVSPKQIKIVIPICENRSLKGSHYKFLIHCNTSIMIILHTYIYTQRWIVNGNIQCFKGLHLVIAVVAIIILALCVGIIPAVFLYSHGVLQVSVCEGRSS